MTEREELLEVARVLIGGGSEADRAKGIAILERLMEDNDHDPIAGEARRQRDHASQPRRVSLEDCEALDALELLWAQIDGLNDPQLDNAVRSAFAIDLNDGPRLRVVREKALGLLKSIGSAGLTVEVLNWLPDVYAAPQAHPDYRDRARDLLAPLAAERFRRRFEDARPKIETDLAQWEIDAARVRLDGLGTPTPDLAGPVTALYGKIATIVTLRSHVEHWLKQMAAPRIRSMADLSALSEVLDQVEAVEQEQPLPPLRRADLREASARLATAIDRWIEDYARNLHKTGWEGAAAFGDELRRLPTRWKYLAQDDRFTPVWEVILEPMRSSIATAGTPEAVAAIAKQLREFEKQLPLSLTNRAQSAAVALEGLANCWQDAVRGERTPLPELSGLGQALTLSPALRRDLDTVTALHLRLDAVEDRLCQAEAAGSEAAADAVCKDLTEMVRSGTAPRRVQQLRDRGHRLTGQLRCLRVLDRWVVKDIIESWLQANPEADRNGVKGLERFLDRVARLATGAPLNTVEEQLKWWSNWKGALETLPDAAHWPPMLGSALARVQRGRLKQLWGDLTEALSAPALVLDRLKVWKHQLKPLDDYAPLKALHERVQQRILAEDFAGAERTGDWVAAERVLKALTGVGVSEEEKASYRLRCELGEAKGERRLPAVVPLRWPEIRRRLPGRMIVVMAEALRQCNGYPDLKQRAEGLYPCVLEALALSNDETADRRTLTLWSEWLPHFQALISSPSEATLVIVTPFFLSLTEDQWGELSAYLKAVIEHWRAAGERFALAYSWRLFRGRIRTALDKDEAVSLQAEAEEKVLAIREVLLQLPDLNRATLTETLGQLSSLLERWESFDRVLMARGSDDTARATLKMVKGVKEFAGALTELANALLKLRTCDFRDRLRGTIDDALALCNTILPSPALLSGVREELYRFQQALGVSGYWDDYNVYCMILFKEYDIPDDTNKNILKAACNMRDHLKALELDRSHGADALAEDGIGLLVKANPGLSRPSGLITLETLVSVIEGLIREDDAAQEKVLTIETKLMPMAGIKVPDDPRYGPFFAAFPPYPPCSRLARQRFHTLIRRDPMPDIVKTAFSRLPEWVRLGAD